jgi:hypothetical protein
MSMVETSIGARAYEAPERGLPLRPEDWRGGLPMRRLGPCVVLAATVAAALAGVSSTIAGGAIAGGADLGSFNPKRFPASPSITNQWLPTLPGTQFVYDGTSVAGGRVVPHRIVSIVSDMTKVVDGVRVNVIWDRDYLSGSLSESELALWAQDNGANVWLLGEHPEEFRNGRFTGAPDTWASGASGARAGVLMRANPRPSTDSYVQGYAPAIEFKDMARVFASGQNVCTPARCYSNVLEIEEWNAFAPAEGHQLKYHAPGVGIVKIGSLDSSDQEVMHLTSVTRLGTSAMNGVRSAVLQLDQRGFQVSADWRTTSPAQPLASVQPLSATPTSTSRSRTAAASTPPTSALPAAERNARIPSSTLPTPAGSSAPTVRSRTTPSDARSPSTPARSPAVTSTTTARDQTPMRSTSTRATGR